MILFTLYASFDSILVDCLFSRYKSGVTSFGGSLMVGKATVSFMRPQSHWPTRKRALQQCHGAYRLA